MGKAVAFITGASRGIGRGIALELASKGYDIVGAATRLDPTNREKGLFEVKDRVEALGATFLPVAGDITNRDDHARMVEAALTEFGTIDILINNAGVAPLERLDILETTEESFERLMRTNVQGPFFLTQRIAAQMIRQIEEGASYTPRIIFITSISSHAASPNRAEYCISKAGLSMAAQNYAVRLAEYGITVFDLRPGIIETDMTAAVKDKYDARIESGLLLQKRWGTPVDIGKACVAIAEGYLDYATGTVIEIGGGFGVHRL